MEHEHRAEAPAPAPTTPRTVIAVPDLTDMGLGSVLGGAKQRRILDRDGTFTSRRVGYPRWSFPNAYHATLTMTWPRFLCLVTMAYAALNALFAAAYIACGGGALGGLSADRMGGTFLRAFFFSVETFATIGYGHVFPVGAAANWLVSVEALIGILAAALLTGLVFARFSRPTARLLFSRSAVVAPYQRRTGFMFRIANARSNQLMELETKLMYSRLDGVGRRYDQLKLERTRVVFFPLSWTIVHPIDETSPLWGLTHEELAAHDAEFDILVAGIDETFAQTVHARTSYKAEEIVFGARFSNIYNPIAADGTISIDVSRLSDIETAALDEDGLQHTQTFRHTGHFTGFVAPPPSG